MKLPSLKKAQLPKAPPLTKLLGPSFILLGLGLGSGEIILWPFLASKYGLGLIWGALIGITLQFFLNMEIARYTLVTGESIFVGFSRKFGRIAPVWFIFATLVPWMWPGIAAASANLIASLLHIPYSNILPISLL
ncbi:Nramp family divalent metal transporter, partial [Candidatus Woesebacteria bacterium]|nr:Nramp family divalent metal transporter [Candidatus Woesebacteria bacterium]